MPPHSSATFPSSRKSASKTSSLATIPPPMAEAGEFLLRQQEHKRQLELDRLELLERIGVQGGVLAVHLKFYLTSTFRRCKRNVSLS